MSITPIHLTWTDPAGTYTIDGSFSTPTAPPPPPPVDNAPVAIIDNTGATTGITPLAVSFTAARSYDVDGDTLTYKWTGTSPDGTVTQLGTAQTASFFCNAAGTYTVTLTVTSNALTATATTTVTATAPPPTPPPVTGFKTFGNQMTYNGKTIPPIRGLEIIYAYQNGGPAWPADMGVRTGKVSVGAGKGISGNRHLFYTGNPADGSPIANGQPCPPSFVASVIDANWAAGLQVDICLAGGKDVNEYLRADMKAVLLPRQSKISALHLLGEAYETNTDAWVARAKDWIAKARTAGYTCPLTIMSINGGRNLKAVLDRGAEIVAADPLANTFLGWQAYWSSDLDNTTDYYQKLSGMSLRTAFQRVAAAPFRIQVGICSEVPDLTIGRHVLEHQAQCVALGLPYLWWSENSSGPLWFGFEPGAPYSNGQWNNSTLTPGQEFATGTNGLDKGTRPTLT